MDEIKKGLETYISFWKMELIRDEKNISIPR